VRRHLERGLEPPTYGPRAPRPRLIEPFEDYLAACVAAYPELSGKRLLREVREMGHAGGYARLTDFLRLDNMPSGWCSSDMRWLS
jgi:hypothetical protein